jgi:hypothetical protein
MTRRDWISIVIIGAGVGLLCQPILSNVAASSGFTMTVPLRIVIFFLFTLIAPLALFILWLIGKLLPVVYQFGKFAAVGVLNTFVDIGVLNLEILLMGTPGAWGYRIFPRTREPRADDQVLSRGTHWIRVERRTFFLCL